MTDFVLNSKVFAKLFSAQVGSLQGPSSTKSVCLNNFSRAQNNVLKHFFVDEEFDQQIQSLCEKGSIQQERGLRML